jgi:hypothetical protein
MHGLFVPGQRERQRNSQQPVLDRFSRPKPQHLLQQKRSTYAARSGRFCRSTLRPVIKLFDINYLLQTSSQLQSPAMLHLICSKTE